MTRKAMTVLLHTMILILAMILGAVLFWYLPASGMRYVAANPPFLKFRTPCLIWLIVFSAPLFASLIPAWQVCSSISSGEGVFTRRNARRLRAVSLLLLTAAFVFPAGMVVLLILGLFSELLSVVITPLVFFAMAGAAIVFYVMGEMVDDVCPS